jgi:hypothetical protein
MNCPGGPNSADGEHSEVVRTSHYWQISSEFAELSQQIAQDPVLMGLYQRGVVDYSALSEVEQGRFHMPISNLFTKCQLVFGPWIGFATAEKVTLLTSASTSFDRLLLRCCEERAVAARGRGMGLDERTREDLNRWLRKARVYLGTFVAGGLLAFAYTYYPLHSAKDWKIDHLEARLQEETIRFTELDAEFRTMRGRVESQPDHEAFDALQEEVAGATTRRGELEEKLNRADRKIRDLEKSRGSWEAKYAKLEKSRDDLARELVAVHVRLIATEDVPRKGDGALDSPSPTGNITAGEDDNDRGSSPASADSIGARRGNGDLSEASSGSRPHSSSSALQAGAK